VILKTKPAGNKIYFTIDSQDYNFFYQPALDKEREYIRLMNDQPIEAEPVGESSMEIGETATDVGDPPSLPATEGQDPPTEEPPAEEPAVEEITPPAVDPESETTTDVGEQVVENSEGLSLQWIETSQAEDPASEVEPVIEDPPSPPATEGQDPPAEEPVVEEITPLTVEIESKPPTDAGNGPPIEEIMEEPTVEEVVSIVEESPAEESIADRIRNLPEEEKYLVGEIDYCTATDCYNIFGMVISHRPENVVGSYAVYHKTKKNHKQGEENYKTGKVAHIYRPKIIDANGNWVWGEMKINNNQIIVTVPQDFFDNGAYPITVDPAIGYTTDPQSTALVIQSQIEAFNYSESDTMPEAGTAKSVWVWWVGGDHDVSNAKMGIYRDRVGVPFTYIDTTTEKTSFPAGAGWLEFTGASAALSNGGIYYPVWWHDADWKEGSLGYDSNGYGTYWIDTETYGGAWPNPYTNNGSDTWKLFGAYIE